MQILNQRKIFKSRNIDYRSRSPTGLVIAPTRELALQIQEVAETYGRPLGISNMCIYGKLISKTKFFYHILF
jgi:superfamily II DNA/RNA helicase